MKRYIYLLFFMVCLTFLYFLSETYESSSLCNLSKNFRVKGQVISLMKMEDGYKIKVCDSDCCKEFYTNDFFMTGENVILCGRLWEKVRRC